MIVIDTLETYLVKSCFQNDYRVVLYDRRADVRKMIIFTQNWFPSTPKASFGQVLEGQLCGHRFSQ